MASGRKFLLIAGFARSVVLFRLDLIKELQGKNLDVHVAFPSHEENVDVIDQLIRAGITVHQIPLTRNSVNPVLDARTIIALVRLLRRIRPRYVMAYTIKPVLYGSIAAWIARVPNCFALVTGLGHSFSHSRAKLLNRIVRQLYRLSLGKVTKVFFQNPDDDAMFRDEKIVPYWMPTVVLNGSGVHLDKFPVAPMPSSRATFLMVARLLEAKGVREFVAAASELRVLHSDVRFRLAGWIDTSPDSISQSELEEWIDHGHIEFLGRLNDVRPAFADSTVYVLPSYREGTPRTVLEALAMGRPIITTDAPGCRETVVDGENGFLVPVKSVDALVEAMQKFIDDPALAERMGKRSREIAEEKYDVHKVNAVMLREMGIT